MLVDVENLTPFTEYAQNVGCFVLWRDNASGVYLEI